MGDCRRLIGDCFWLIILDLDTSGCCQVKVGNAGNPIIL